MLSKNNKMINVKVSKDTFDFIKTFSRKYGTSISSFCQDCITQYILFHDKESRKEKYCSSDFYYKKLSNFINRTYDERRK